MRKKPEKFHWPCVYCGRKIRRRQLLFSGEYYHRRCKRRAWKDQAWRRSHGWLVK